MTGVIRILNHEEDCNSVGRAKLETVQPNKAHLDIAALEKDYDVVVVTLNVDKLHEKATSGIAKVIEMIKAE